MLSELLPDDPGAPTTSFAVFFTHKSAQTNRNYHILSCFTSRRSIQTNHNQSHSHNYIHPQPHYSIHTLTDTNARNKPSTHREENNTLHKKARAGNNLQKKHRYNEVAYSTDKKKFNIREAITYCQWFQMRSRCCAPLLCAFQCSIRPRYFTQTFASCLF